MAKYAKSFLRYKIFSQIGDQRKPKKLNTNYIFQKVQELARGRGDWHVSFLHTYYSESLSFFSCLMQQLRFQARFFLAIADLLPIAEVFLEECDSNPLRVAKTPKTMKGKYIANSLSDALLESIISDNIAICNPQTTKRC